MLLCCSSFGLRCLSLEGLTSLSLSNHQQPKYLNTNSTFFSIFTPRSILSGAIFSLSPLSLSRFPPASPPTSQGWCPPRRCLSCCSQQLCARGVPAPPPHHAGNICTSKTPQLLCPRAPGSEPKGAGSSRIVIQVAETLASSSEGC